MGRTQIEKHKIQPKINSIGKNKSTRKNHKEENPKIKTRRKSYLQIKTLLSKVYWHILKFFGRKTVE